MNMLRCDRSRYAKGLTLIELIVSLVLVSVLASITAVFLRVPMQSYFVSRQRIDLTDSIELGMRHMDQELRQALPNSVRVPAAPVLGVSYIEFLATRGNARYRTSSGGPAAGTCAGNDQLVPGAPDDCFTTLGQFTPISTIQPMNDYVVLGQSMPTADAYSTGIADSPNKSRITALPVAVGAAPSIETLWRINNVALTGAASPLIYIVSGPVTYACDSVAGQLVRYSGYPITAAQPTPPLGATRSVIASNLAVCNPRYSPATNALMQGIVSVQVTLRNNLPGGQDQEEANFLVQAPASKTP